MKTFDDYLFSFACLVFLIGAFACIRQIIKPDTLPLCQKLLVECKERSDNMGKIIADYEDTVNELRRECK
jgi:hypothetical protein